MTEMRDRDCRSESAYTGMVERAADEVLDNPRTASEYAAELARGRAQDDRPAIWDPCPICKAEDVIPRGCLAPGNFRCRECGLTPSMEERDRILRLVSSQKITKRKLSRGSGEL